jgi:phage tail sheath protein FI
MPETSFPGVFIEEIERGPKPIEGVATSTAAFLGETQRGPLSPQLVTSYSEYERWFGGAFAPDKYMPHAVSGFFQNGGTRATIVRIVGRNGKDPTDADYQGGAPADGGSPRGLDALASDAFRDVALVYAPGRSDKATLGRIIAHCENQRFRFALLDCDQAVADVSDPRLDPRTHLRDTQYAAFYYPWIHVSDPQSGGRKKVPPGGHVLGIYARSDIERGVFKAPANEPVRGALDLEYLIDDSTQDVLDSKGVNAIRKFSGRGIRVWGARTLSSDALWKYVSVRRLFIFLEHSIHKGTQWVVFEPNDERLWARVTDAIRLFLRAQWRLGAMAGGTGEEAFFVVCDRTTMTQDDILNGRLVCEIGIAPVRPAEFVIFRIFQRTAEAQR